jgi:ribosomal protein S18 acetylase RimI-like enzyme
METVGPYEDDPFGQWPGRTPLFGDDGELLLVFTLAESTRNDRRWVDACWRPPTADVDACCEAVLDAFAGDAFTSLDIDLAHALLASGADEIRHAHSMSHSLDPLPSVQLPDSLAVAQLTGAELESAAAELGDVSVRAYPDGHPDHEHVDRDAAADELRQFARGTILGPYLEVSTVATLGGRRVGACLVVQREGEPPDGGPWIVDVFRDPDAAVPGIGAALIAASLASAQAAGLPGLSLVVTDANHRARRLYRRLGFVEGLEAWTLALPGR